MDFLVILDFEATCDEYKLDIQEIIELPAVLLDGKTGKVVDEYHTYVRPRVCKKLSTFCKNLTGITQQQVDDGVDLVEALSGLCAFLAKHGLTSSVTSSTPSSLSSSSSTVEAKKTPKSWCFATCGDWDFKTMLPAALRQVDLAHLLISSSAGSAPSASSSSTSFSSSSSASSSSSSSSATLSLLSVSAGPSSSSAAASSPSSSASSSSTSSSSSLSSASLSTSSSSSSSSSSSTSSSSSSPSASSTSSTISPSITLPCLSFMTKSVNIKRAFADVYNEQPRDMDGMLAFLKLPLIGRHHSGIDDARNIAAIARRIMCDATASFASLSSSSASSSSPSSSFDWRSYISTYDGRGGFSNRGGGRWRGRDRGFRK